MKEVMAVYKIVSRKTGRYYIGSSVDVAKRIKRHSRALASGKHHNKHLQQEYSKNGKDNFDITIIARYKTEVALRKAEVEYIKRASKCKGCLNIGKGAIGGDNLTRNPNRESIVSKISKTVRKNMQGLTQEERIKKFGKPGAANGMYRRTHSKEARARISKANLGQSRGLGIKKSEQGRLNIKRAAQERVKRKDYENPFAGKEHSAETKKILSDKAKARHVQGFLPTNCRKVSVEGVEYVSLREASRKTNVSPALLIYRIKSTSAKYKSYKYIN